MVLVFWVQALKVTEGLNLFVPLTLVLLVLVLTVTEDLVLFGVLALMLLVWALLVQTLPCTKVLALLILVVLIPVLSGSEVLVRELSDQCSGSICSPCLLSNSNYTSDSV